MAAAIVRLSRSNFYYDSNNKKNKNKKKTEKQNKNKIQPRQQVVIQILWSILQNEKLTGQARMGRGKSGGGGSAAYAAIARSTKIYVT